MVKEAVPQDRRRSRRAIGWLVVVVTAAATAPASAAGKGAGATMKLPAAPGGAGKSDARSQAKAAVEKAQVDYKLGRFQDALDGYRRAYELYQAPVLLFDIAQCHRNLGDPDKAIFFFEGYLREETRPEPERRKLTQDLIDELRGQVQRQRAAAMAAAAARPTTPAPRPIRPRVKLEAIDQTRANTAPTLARAPEPASRRQQRSIATRWWFWTAIGGALAAGAAVYYATGDPRLVRPTIGTLPGTPPSGASP
jgi:tetratricopeptide (TPR) repeat protein